MKLFALERSIFGIETSNNSAGTFSGVISSKLIGSDSKSTSLKVKLPVSSTVNSALARLKSGLKSSPFGR